MPTYDYHCTACDHRYELFQPITARPTKKCPSCGRQTAKRLIGAGAGVIFKGSGFYQTDYRSDSYRQAAKADSDKATVSKPTETKAAETKPAESKPADSKPKGGGKEGKRKK
jgi:putative FmdB family regulatory protein